jgi:hypothetical protein
VLITDDNPDISTIIDIELENRLKSERLIIGDPTLILEIQDALSVVPGDTVWNPSNLLNDIFSTMVSCGSLLIVDEEELTVRFVHHSVKQYMMNELNIQADREYDFTLNAANTAMANVILTYLNYGVFGTQLSTVLVPQIHATSAPYEIIRSTLGSITGSQNIALKLLRSRKLPDFEMGKTLMEACGRGTSHLPNEFHFVKYAELNWLPHVLSVPSLETVIQDLLVKLLFQGKAKDADADSEYLRTLKSVPEE